MVWAPRCCVDGPASCPAPSKAKEALGVAPWKPTWRIFLFESLDQHSSLSRAMRKLIGPVCLDTWLGALVLLPRSQLRSPRSKLGRRLVKSLKELERATEFVPTTDSFNIKLIPMTLNLNDTEEIFRLDTTSQDFLLLSCCSYSCF